MNAVEASSSFKLWGAMRRDDLHACFSEMLVRMASMNTSDYIGLRESAEAALQRASWWDERLNKDTHVLFSVSFHPLGVCHCITIGALAKVHFPPFFSDHGIWHFYGDLPLAVFDAHTQELLLEVEFHAIV